MLYNTCLRPDNEQFIETYEIENFIQGSNLYRYEHPQRRWEYGLAMRLMKEFSPQTMLNVGGGSSPLSSWAVESGIRTTEIDPTPPTKELPEITYICREFPTDNMPKNYDLIVCTSVIEHVKDDMKFFKSLLDYSVGLVFITMDFSPTEKAFSISHHRTYSESNIINMINIGKTKGFNHIGELDYRYDKPMVYEYTFAALALGRL